MEKSRIAILALAVVAAIVLTAPASLRAQDNNDEDFWADEDRPRRPRSNSQRNVLTA